MIRIVFHGENAASFSDGFADLLDMSSEIAVLPDALGSPANRAAYADADAAMSGWKQVIGDGLRAQGDERRGNRGGRCRPRAQPHAGLGTPKLRPRGLIPDTGRTSAPTLPAVTYRK